VARDLGRTALPFPGKASRPEILKRPALQVYGGDYAPMQFFLWGITPLISRLVGRELLPTYDYFRVYRAGDICRVHSDREACEHSLSLALGYSDGRIWDLEIEESALASGPGAVEDDFSGQKYASIGLQPGDALLYRGVDHRHGRTIPNPNRWSAHLFMHWVESDGPYRDQAFDGIPPESKVSFG
ncbi:MAG TPA: hypothetical protein VK403_05905, partial [Allosphingosinicella sp.]|nr:hypothetical protein [Allosphingosinicella sp.]